MHANYSFPPRSRAKREWERGRRGMGYRSPSAAEGDIQRTRGNPNFGIQLPDFTLGHKYWDSGFPSAWAQQEARSRLGFASAMEGGHKGGRHKRHWVSTEELTLWQRHCLGKSSFGSRIQTMGVAVNSPEAPIQTQWA